MNYTDCMSRANTEEDFWNRVNKRGPRSSEMSTRCWLWTGGVSKQNGYGVFPFRGKVVRAHRAAYIFKKGSIPENHDLHHKCHVITCVRPSHLEPKLHADHILEFHPHRLNLKTHCPYGHPYVEENLLNRSSGRRDCKECHRLRRKRQVAEGKVRSDPTIEFCKRGHHLTEENVGRPPSGGWYCKACRIVQQQERRAG